LVEVLVPEESVDDDASRGAGDGRSSKGAQRTGLLPSYLLLDCRLQRTHVDRSFVITVD